MEENSYDKLLKELYSSLVNSTGFIDFLIQLNKYLHLSVSCIEIFSNRYKLDDNFWLVKENGGKRRYDTSRLIDNRNGLITSLHQAPLGELVEIEESNNDSNRYYSIVLVNNADWVCRVYFKHHKIKYQFSLEDDQLLLNLLPHIQHALRIYLSKLNRNKTHFLQSLLFEQTSFPIIILDNLGGVQYSNPQAKIMLKKYPFLQEVDMALHQNITDLTVKSPIKAMIRKCRNEKEIQVLMLNLDNNSKLMLSCIPLLPTKTIPKSGVAVFIYNSNKININQEILCQLYGLTAKESMVCNELVAGRSLAEIATVTYLSYQTVRTYIKCIMAKTSTSRQGELIIRILTSPACNLIYKMNK